MSTLLNQTPAQHHLSRVRPIPLRDHQWGTRQRRTPLITISPVLDSLLDHSPVCGASGSTWVATRHERLLLYLCLCCSVAPKVMYVLSVLHCCLSYYVRTCRVRYLTSTQIRMYIRTGVTPQGTKAKRVIAERGQNMFGAKRRTLEKTPRQSLPSTQQGWPHHRWLS